MRYCYLWADVGRGIVMDALRNPLRATDLIAYARDGMIWRIFFVVQNLDAATGLLVWEPFPIGANDVLEVTVKKLNQFQSGKTLIYSDNADWNKAGDWADMNRSEGKCCVRISANTPAIVELFANDDPDETVTCDITIQPAGELPATVQFDFTLSNDVRRGNEGAAAEKLPDYATLNYVLLKIKELTHPPHGRYKIENGAVYLRDRTTGLYVSMEGEDRTVVTANE